MQYADYAFYVGTYHGRSIQEADFDRLALRASDYIDYLTMRRATDGAATAKACCAVADALAARESHAGVASESNDGMSVTYARDARTEQQCAAEVARPYLYDLFLWGVRRC